MLARLLRGFLAGLRDAGPGPQRLRGFTLCEVEPDRFARLRDALWRLLATDELLREFEVQVSERVLPAAPEPARGQGAVAAAGAPLPRPAVYPHLREEAATPGSGRGGGQAARRATVAALLTPVGKAAILRGRREQDRGEIDALLAEIEAEEFGPEALPGFGERLARAVLPDNVRALQERFRAAIEETWRTAPLGQWMAHAEVARPPRGGSATLPRSGVARGSR